MTFERSHLPDALSYFENQGLKLSARGKWRTTACAFHGGSDSMRINLQSGGWCCMACDAKGGDILSYHMAVTGLEFVDAAKALGAWVEDGKLHHQHKPTPLSPRQALQVMAVECNLVAVAAGNVAHGIALTQLDLARVMQAGSRIARLTEVFA